MQCMVCATELLHAANFCPVCGARLAAPPQDGTTATTPGNEPPGVVIAMPEQPEPNVVYLPGAEQPTPPEPGTVPPNPHALEYAGVDAVPDPYVPGTAPPHDASHEAPAPTYPHAAPPAADLPPMHPAAEPGGYAAQLAASLQHDLGSGPIDTVAPAIVTSGSHGPLVPEQLVPPETVETNPFGDFFSDGPSAWLEDDSDDDSVDGDVGGARVVGTLLAFAAIALLLGAWGVWGYGMYRDAGGAEAAPLLLLSLMAWIRYLTLPREQQHRALLRRHVALTRFVDRRIVPIHRRTEGSLAMRRERDRYRAMRDERQRRIAALGEAAQRSFRHGQLPTDLHGPAQRVLAIERQMLAQDTRIHQLMTQQGAADGSAMSRTEAASDASAPGQPPA